MAYSVVFTPEARAQLIALYRYMAVDASPAIAQRFTDAIVNHCERFRELPARSNCPKKPIDIRQDAARR
jgi:plasmid stabilization system protein ParE